MFDLHDISAKRIAGQYGKSVRRIITVLTLALLLPALAHAYTIVMRDGRRIEIPDSFHLTQITLTYEAAPSISVTLQVRHIDAAATERANNESRGAFARRAASVSSTQTSPDAPPVNQPVASRTLTNRDLSDYARAREASERAYERRRRELNLPAPDPRAEEEAMLALAQSARENREAERYWRARASALRAEIVSLDAEINFLRARLFETPEYPALNATIVSTNGFFGAYPVVPFGVTTNSLAGQSSIGLTQSGAQVVGQIGFGGGRTRGIVSINAGTFSGSTYHRVIVPPRARPVAPFIGYAPVIAYPYFNYPSDRSLIIARLNEIEAARAGYIARWRLLEDEARRAGALPGWLR